MKKIINFLCLISIIFSLTSCKKEDKNEDTPRTYMHDGVYMAWSMTQSETTLLNDTGKYLNPEGNEVKVYTPNLITVKVTIVNDKIIDFYIDELASTAKVVSTDDNGYVTKVTWTWDKQSKKELLYDYGMQSSYGSCKADGICNEWFIQANNIEQAWLKKGLTEGTTTGATISTSNYFKVAQKAIDNAKNGNVMAITDKEHYTYDVTYVTGKIDKTGKISNIKLDAWLFGNIQEDTYTNTSDNYLKFSWNEQSKYSSYPLMSNDKSWQDMIDQVNKYINDNGWSNYIGPGRYYDDVYKDKGLNKGNVEILSSVTIQLSNEVIVMNMLNKFFPYAW